MQGAEKFTGPLLVALGASLWATDSLFRAPVGHRYSPLWIVTINHILLLLPCLLIIYHKRVEISKITRRGWWGLLYLASFVSVLGTVAFTEAFVNSSNYSVPVLLQKVQPCFAIVLAHLFLGEKIGLHRWPLIGLALAGTYLLSFGLEPVWLHWDEVKGHAIVYSLLAALIWGSGTVVGSLLLKDISFPLVTALRFFLGAIFSLGLSLSLTWQPGSQQGILPETFLSDLSNFLAMAFISGFLPIWIYYRGLRNTPVAVATLCELAFPIVAILLNWIYLGAALNGSQLAGAVLIVLAITILARKA